MSRVLIFSLLICGSCLAARASETSESKIFPEEIKLGVRTVQRHGVGHRIASMFHVKVYVAAFYSEKKTTKDLLESDQIKLIDLNPLYEISKEDSEKGWKLALQDACAQQCQEIQSDQQAFLKSVPPFKKGDHQRYLFTSGQLEVFLNEKSIFKSKNKNFAQVLLKTWIGEKPVSESLKKELLGQDSVSK